MARRGGTRPDQAASSALHGDACLAVRNSFPAFLSQTMIQPESSTSGSGGLAPLTLQSTQTDLARELVGQGCGMPGPWHIVCKPRQAMTSTLAVAWLLRELEYTPGYNGAIICDKDDTNAELTARLRLMLDSQHPMIRVPQQKLTEKGIQFSHGGRLKVVTAKGSNPAIGLSIDRLLCSEFGFWSNADKVVSLLFPTLLKRPQARVVIESTPGPHGSAYHQLWLDSLAGKTRFKPHFICWWKHPGYASSVTEAYTPDPVIADIYRRYAPQGMTLGHARFMETALMSVFNGSIERFRAAYPFDPLDGWLAGGIPALPKEPLAALINDPRVQSDPRTMGDGWEQPRPGETYKIFVDPNSYGDSGDPSALTIWSVDRREEVGSWEGRIDPAKLGALLCDIGLRWNKAELVVESNASACITVLRERGYRPLYGDVNGMGMPGYYRTRQRKEDGMAALCTMLYSGELDIRSREGLLQLLAYDGSDKRRSMNGSVHHWDRVVTYCMAADILSKIPARKRPPAVQVRPGHVAVSSLMRHNSTPPPPRF